MKIEIYFYSIDRRNEKRYYDEDEELNEAKLDNNDPDIKKKDFRR